MVFPFRTRCLFVWFFRSSIHPRHTAVLVLTSPEVYAKKVAETELQYDKKLEEAEAPSSDPASSSLEAKRSGRTTV